MSDTQHTQGPWAYGDGGTEMSQHVCDENGNIGLCGVSVSDPMGKDHMIEVVRVEEGDWPDGEYCVEQICFLVKDGGLANARLIAAAPDLLRACENLLLGLFQRVPDAEELLGGAIRRARTAIATAKGETQ